MFNIRISKTDFKEFQSTIIGDITIMFKSSILSVSVPFASHNSLFYKIENDYIQISDDLRTFYSSRNEISIESIYSFLTFGGVIPPNTIFNNVYCFIPGFEYTINVKKDFEIKKREIVVFPYKLEEFKSRDLLDCLTQTFDDYLAKKANMKSNVLLFSGGIDSSFIASRLKKVSDKDITLLHCSFGENDEETKVATEIANKLELSIEIFKYKDYHTFEPLINATSYYSYPFGDHSIIPTFSIVKYLNTSYKNVTVFEGTGADGSMGMHDKINKMNLLYNLPRIFRGVGAYFYKQFSLYYSVSKAETVGRQMYKSRQNMILNNFISQHSLTNIAYSYSKERSTHFNKELSDWILPLVNTNSNYIRLSLVDIAFICARIYAQKSSSLFNNIENDLVFPFLNQKLINKFIQFPFKIGEPKWLLKKSLENEIPKNLIYRKKSGFIASPVKLFNNEIILDLLLRILGNKSVLTDLINKNLLDITFSKLRNKEVLPISTYNYVWSLVFMESWLSGLGAYKQDLKK